MRVQYKFLLLIPLVFSALSPYGCALASSYFEAPPHEQQTWGLLSTAAYLTEPTEGSAAASTHSLLEASQDTAVASGQTLHLTSSNSSVHAGDRVKKRGPSGRVLSSTRRRLSFCLLLIISAGLLTALIKRVAAVPPIPEEERISFPLEPSDDTNFIKGRERLEKVKKLLPAAERLAAVLDSAEAGGLLTTLKTTLSAAQSHRNADALDSSLITALTALQQLHQRATAQAMALSQTEELFVNLREIGEWAEDTNSIISELQHKELQKALKPFVGTVRSVLSDVEKIAKKIKEKGERLRAEQRKFRNEGDGELLLSAARDLECLYTSSMTSGYLLDLADEIHECSLDTVKAVLVTEREIDAWGLDITIVSLCIRHSQARSLTNAASGGPQGGPPGGPAEGLRGVPHEELMKTVKKLEKQLTGVSRVARRLGENVMALKSASSLREALASNARIAELLREAEVLSGRGAAAAADIVLSSEVLDGTTKEILLHATGWLENFIKIENEVLSHTVGQAEASAAVSAGRAFIGEDLARKQRGLVHAAARSALNRTAAIAAAIGRLKEAKFFTDTGSLLDEVLGAIKAQREDKKEILVASQKSSFLQIIEDNLNDVNAAVGEVEKARRRLHPQGPKEMLFKEIRKKFEAEKQRMQDAVTLEEAAEAAAKARAAAVGLQEFLFNSN